MNIVSYLRQTQTDFKPRHIVHAGAHHGQEASAYDALGPASITWIEADPDVFQVLSGKLERNRHLFNARHRCAEALLADRDGQVLSFHRYSNQGASSSVFRSLPRLRKQWPDVVETGEVLELRSSTLDSVLERVLPGGTKVDVLVLDLQGAELDCLKGAEKVLEDVRFLQCEVSTKPIYDGGVLYEDLNDHLLALGFIRRTEVPRHGDVLYERPQIVQAERTHCRSQDGPAAWKRLGRLWEKVGLAPAATTAGGDGTIAGPCLYDLEPLFRDAKECRTDRERKRVLEFAEALSAKTAHSPAQLAQDYWVEHQLSGLRGGFFVDVGAGDGEWLSNTQMLENRLGWRGLCVEPSPSFAALRARRKCLTDPRCVWRSSGETLTLCVPPTIHLSTIKAFALSDMHAESRRSALEIAVESVSLEDLLLEHDAPPIIDYLSIDTEGSELEILKGFDFGRYDIRCMTIEHNFTANGARLDALLEGRGFRRVLRNFSRFDAWYVKDSR